MQRVIKIIIIFIGFLALWISAVRWFELPDYLLPLPQQVLFALINQAPLLFDNSLTTITEILLGFTLGIIFGGLAGMIIAYFRPLKEWFLPIIIISQAVPIFAIAPLIIVWLGYGLASKIMITVLMIFFPITSTFYDGLIRTNPAWLDLANAMHANKLRTFIHIRLPAALPALASGIRIAAVIAPLGAVMGEWVGASNGLGYVMLNANGRMQIDLMFAALSIVIVLSGVLYFGVDIAMKRLVKHIN